MRRTRFGASFTIEEVKVVDAVFKTLQRGGDVGTLMRLKALHRVMAKFSAMSGRAEFEPPKPKPLTDAERLELLKQRRDRKNARDRERGKAERAILRAERFVGTLPRAELRPTPYVFTEWEKLTIIGLWDIIPYRWLAKYFGLPENSLKGICRRWRNEMTAKSLSAVDAIPCAAE